MPEKGPAAVKVIVDTDIGGDCDDAGALAVLHALADNQEVDILACIYSSGKNPYGVGCIDAINTWYGRPEIPIGAYKRDDVGHTAEYFLESIATDRSTYGHRLVTAAEAPDLVTVYRQVLTSQADQSVVIVSIGHVAGLHYLLESAGDEHSPQGGRELVAQKVRKWVCNGGYFPKGPMPCFNFGACGGAAYSKRVVENWPTPIDFTDAGTDMLTGMKLRDTPTDNPVRECYRLYNLATYGEEWPRYSRPSWDQLTVYYAVRGIKDYFYEVTQGGCEVFEDGRTEWKMHLDRDHTYFKRSETAFMTNIVEGLMTKAPGEPLSTQSTNWPASV